MFIYTNNFKQLIYKIIGINKILNMTKKEIIYPVFLECVQYAPDSFWKNVFEDLAYGKTSYGTYINKNFLCCSYKDKEFSYKIERKNPNELYNEIYNLLTNKVGILSQKEKIKKRIEFHKTETRLKELRQDWSNIKKKNIKDILIERYVIDMKNKHSLNLQQSKLLLSVIFISIVFKVITTKDVEYSNGKIQNIKGVEFNNNKIILKRNIYDLEISFSPEILIDKKLMADNWLKFLENLRKERKNK
jgi:hypothetical protein